MVGYDGPIYMTHPTQAICPILLEDYRKIAVDKKGEANFFTSQMIKDCMKKVVAVHLHQTVQVRVSGRHCAISGRRHLGRGAVSSAARPALCLTPWKRPEGHRLACPVGHGGARRAGRGKAGLDSAPSEPRRAPGAGRCALGPISAMVVCGAGKRRPESGWETSDLVKLLRGCAFARFPLEAGLCLPSRALRIAVVAEMITSVLADKPLALPLCRPPGPRMFPSRAHGLSFLRVLAFSVVVCASPPGRQCRPQGRRASTLRCPFSPQPVSMALTAWDGGSAAEPAWVWRGGHRLASCSGAVFLSCGAPAPLSLRLYLPSRCQKRPLGQHALGKRFCFLSLTCSGAGCPVSQPGAFHLPLPG